MFVSEILVYSALAVIAQAIPWRGPQETVFGNGLVPTAVVNLPRDAEPTAYPVSLCGWVAGDGELPAWCSSSSSCVWHTDYSIVGCCAMKSDNCAIYTDCIDINSPKPDEDKSDVYTCRGTSLCYKNTYPDDYTQWGCGSSDWATTVLTSFSDYDTNLAFPIAYTGLAASTTEDVEPQTETRTIDVYITKTPSAVSTAEEEEETTDTTSSRSPTARGGLPPSQSSPVNEEEPPPPSPFDDEEPSPTSPAMSEDTTSSAAEGGGKSSTPVGAIAGGVVGGIAGVALVVAGAYFFLRSRRRKSAEVGEAQQQDMQEATGTGGSAAQSGRISELYSPKQSPGPSELYSPSQSPDPRRTEATMSNPFPGKAAGPPVELP